MGPDPHEPTSNTSATTAEFVRDEAERPSRTAPYPLREPPAEEPTDFPKFAEGDVLLERFQIVRLLGQGGMGIVYLAIDRSRRQEDAYVALKFPKLEPTYWKQLQHEWQQALKISHKNVLRVYDVHNTDTALFIAMEYVPECLRRMLTNGRTLSPEKVLQIGKGICQGLQAIHERGKFHQDLKPDNIMIAADGEAKVSDLGLVASHFGSKGTPAYMAPELLWQGSGPSAQSDIYSLGLILFQMVCGEAALVWNPDQRREQARNSLKGPRIDFKLSRLILRCLEPNPKHRPESVLELLEDLKKITDTEKGALSLPYNTRPNGEPLRTKLVASIGRNKSERHGEELATRLLSGGADVIRIDLSTCDSVEEVRDLVKEVRSAVRKHENSLGQARLHAVWVDLPGPLLHLDLAANQSMPWGVDDLIHVALGSRSKTADAGLYTDDIYLLDSATALDKKANYLVSDSKAVEHLHLFLSHIGPLEASQLPDHDEPTADTIFELVTGLHNRNHSYRKRMEIDILTGIETNEAFLVSEETGLVLLLEGLHLSEEWLKCRVVRSPSKPVQSRVPVAFRGLDCSLPTCTTRDLEYARAALDVDLEDGTEERVAAYLGLRHVQTADELLRLREVVESHLDVYLRQQQRSSSRKEVRFAVPSILATIESRRGFLHRSYILDVADGVVVGNGDLAIFGDRGSTPERRRKLARLANKRGKPVLGFCQLGPGPEAGRDAIADAFALVQDGVDAVALPERITSGSFPEIILGRLKVVAASGEEYFEFAGYLNPEIRSELRTSRLLDFLKDDYERIKINERRLSVASLACTLPMAEIGLLSTQAGSQPEPGITPGEGSNCDLGQQLNWRLQLYNEKRDKAVKQEVTNRITESACLLAETSDAKAIITASTSGRTSRMVARMRGRVVTIGVTHDPINARKLVLSYGVIPTWMSEIQKGDAMGDLYSCAVDRLVTNRDLSDLLRGQVVFTCGFPPRQPGTTNLIQLRSFPGP